MAMEYEMLKIGEPPLSRLLLKVNEAEAVFYRRFGERHGGSFVEVRSPKDGDRLEHLHSFSGLLSSSSIPSS
jgi:hypothetical protein